jgi:cobalt transporter subunit CbtB
MAIFGYHVGLVSKTVCAVLKKTLGGIIMLNKITSFGTTDASIIISKSAQLASAFLLGFMLLYGAGFIQTSAAHNASHDVRHAHAFPCH